MTAQRVLYAALAVALGCAVLLDGPSGQVLFGVAGIVAAVALSARTGQRLVAGLLGLAGAGVAAGQPVVACAALLGACAVQMAVSVRLLRRLRRLGV